jgi:SAM-dependent methyltransferase
MNDTLNYYENNFEDAVERYERVDSSLFLQELPIWVPNGGKILDLGCGSGRDASFLLQEEYDVYGIDGSAKMIEEAVRLHPELKGRLVHQVLPSPLPFADDTFDAVVSIALFMHFDIDTIEKICREIRRVLDPHGVFWLSIRLDNELADQDHETERTDESDRFFLDLSTARWRKLIEQFGFYCKKFYTDDDALGRTYAWGRFAFLKDHRE